jgi:DNA-binding XRE family transcriptional regulator
MANPPAPVGTMLGQALRRKRGASTQADAAAELGLATLSISRLERGTHRPNTDTARKLSKWLGWTVEQVLDAADTPLPLG